MFRKPHPDPEFRRFAAQTAPSLLRAGYILLHNADLAEDAVQVTMLQVFRNWERAREAPEAYSRQVLVNVCRDHWRRQARRPAEVLIDETIADTKGANFADRIEQREELLRALADLPVTQREVLVLRYFVDLSIEETARFLEISEGTVKSASSRGLAQLRNRLASSSEAEAC